MRISDWSSDVCSSDLRVQRLGQLLAALTGLLLGLMVPPEPAAKGHQRENDQRQQPNTIAHPEAGKPILAQRVVDFAQKNLVVLWREGQNGSPMGMEYEWARTLAKESATEKNFLGRKH